MEALSLDLRERVCSACDEGTDSRQEVADRFDVSRSFVQKLLRRRREHGSIAAKPRGRGPAPRIGTQDLKRLRGLVNDEPDATLAELCVRLHGEGRGGPLVSVSTMCRALQALRLPLKKRRCTPVNATRCGCGRCGATGRRRCVRWTRRSWYSWTRAASTPR